MKENVSKTSPQTGFQHQEWLNMLEKSNTWYDQKFSELLQSHIIAENKIIVFEKQKNEAVSHNEKNWAARQELERKLAEAKELNTDLTTKIAEAEKETIRVKNDKHTYTLKLKADIEALKKGNAEDKKKVQEFHKVNKQLNDKLVLLQTSAKTVQGQMLLTDKEKKLFTEQLTQAQESVKTAQVRAQKMEKEGEILRKRNEEMTNLLADEKKKYDIVWEKRTEFLEQSKQRLEKVKELKSTCRGYEKEIAELKNALAELRKKNISSR